MAIDAVAIIPARLASTRFPRKVLADQTGRPLIAHVAEAAAHASCVSRVVVAADSAEIDRALRPFRIECVLTGDHHENGTSRLDEAAERLDLPPDALILNVQGDEPEIDPALLDAAAEALVASGRGVHPEADAATVASPFDPGQDPRDPNIVKVVRARDGSALYFSRALIPHDRDGDAPTEAAPLRHVGLYAYRRASLREYVALPPTPLERAERLEQLRLLEHGRRIMVAVCAASHTGVDTPEQYASFVRRWKLKNG